MGRNNVTGSQRRGNMKEICKNCIHHKPTYKGGICEVKNKKTKQQDTCEEWRAKR